MKTIKKLVEALLNATIMLLIGFAVLGIVLMGRVREVVDAVHDELATPMAELVRIANSIDGIEAELADPVGPTEMTAIASDVALLRLEIAVVTKKLNALGNLTVDGLVTEIVQTMSERLAVEPEAAVSQ